MLNLSLYVILMHIAIIFLAFYYLYAKYFRFSNNQNETSEDLHSTSTVSDGSYIGAKGAGPTKNLTNNM